jgi:hypothetical protein
MLNGVPSTLIITYQTTYILGVPTATATYTYTLPQPTAGTPMDYTLAIRDINGFGGLWITNASGVLQFVPVGTIVEITAQ